jgi:hypothetical protein
MEAESAALAAGWSLQRGFPGYTGGGYISWNHGNTSESITQPGSGVMTYIIEVPAAGTYRFRARATSPGPGDAYNDIWFRILGDGGRAIATKNSATVQLGNDFAKMYNNSTNTWTWQSSHVDHNAHDIYFVFDAPGEYAFQIAGRSNQFRLDRFVIYDPQIDDSVATNINQPESPRG